MVEEIKQRSLILTDEIILLIEWCFPEGEKLFFDYSNIVIFCRRYVALKKKSFINSFIGINQAKEIDNATSYLVCCLRLADLFLCDEQYLRVQINRIIKDEVKKLTDEYLNNTF